MAQVATIRSIRGSFATVALASAILSGSPPPIAMGQCPEGFAHLVPSDGERRNEFGTSVSISGDVAVIGTPFNAEIGFEAGAAYVYASNGSGWREEQKLTGLDVTEGDRFGVSVAVSGDFAVVGSYRDDDRGSDSGSAYVFRYSGSRWVQEQKLIAADGASGDLFGFAVAISGDTIVVGALLDDDRGNDSGSAYVFRRSGFQWTQERKFLPADTRASQWFGQAVAISGDVIVVGSMRDSSAGVDSGAAYVFRRNSSFWVQEQRLVAADAEPGDWFGYSVGVAGNVVAVGAQRESENGPAAGAAYAFRFNGSRWLQEAKLLASDGGSVDRFGSTIAAWGEYIAVGAPTHDAVLTNTGGAYLYRYAGGSWSETEKLVSPDGFFDDQFGNSVSAADGAVLIGAFNDNINGVNSGAAYIRVLCDSAPTTDVIAPSVAITSPGNGTTVAGTVTITAQASDNVGVARVEFLIDGVLRASDSTNPYTYAWNTTQQSSGNHTVAVRATDTSGNAANASISVTVNNSSADTTPPSVTISSPRSGETVSGTVTVSASAFDNKGVSHVEFLVDGARQALDTTNPYSFSWNTSSAGNGAHTVSARATDAAGNANTHAVTVTVSNGGGTGGGDSGGGGQPAVTITTPTDGSVISGAVWIAAQPTVGVSVSRVDFSVDGTLMRIFTGTPYIWILDSSRLADGTHTIVAEATDSRGNTTSHSIDVIKGNASNVDRTPPTVSITAPSNGATVSGTVAVAANASDSGGIQQVEFLVDGVRRGTDSTSPYTHSWNTTLESDGGHTLTAKATDRSGNTSTQTVNVTVANTRPDTTPPTVSITSPTNGSVVSATTTVSASAFDNEGVRQVEFLVDGNRVATDTTSPYSFAWNTTLTSDGTHTLSARATDNAGFSSTDSVTVTVTNVQADTTPPTVSITSPSFGATVSGTTNVSASAFDNQSVSSVEFLVDNVAQATDATSPYSFSWDTTQQTNGSHTLTAKATDSSGNVSTQSITVTVNNVSTPDPEPPGATGGVTFTTPTNGSTVNGTVWVVGQAPSSGTPARVDFYVDDVLKRIFVSAPYIWIWNAKEVSNGAHTMTVKTYDASGQMMGEETITVTVSN